MAKRSGDFLKKGDRVVAAKAFRGVPVGTRGKVILVDGIEWIRYRVYFETGVDAGSVNRSDLLLVDKKGELVTVD